MSAPRATAAILAACASALLAAGCAGAPKDSAGDFRGERKQVATTVEDLQDAGRKRDESKICDDLLSAGLVAQIIPWAPPTDASAKPTPLFAPPID